MLLQSICIPALAAANGWRGELNAGGLMRGRFSGHHLINKYEGVQIQKARALNRHVERSILGFSKGEKEKKHDSKCHLQVWRRPFWLKPKSLTNGASSMPTPRWASGTWPKKTTKAAQLSFRQSETSNDCRSDPWRPCTT
ncbi:hypothetical protein MPH_13208 [Macrophomina phaseolina MS6]|uniref:Uncharacterized protein n=1 Tax=Macrophomina phaseolina (strain MS6) TaxID=1126212 RepID=K2QIN7_MACPH|nr:hypothetical protein MPH_13208 [Macrophomina phaseolina MS6]